MNKIFFGSLSDGRKVNIHVLKNNLGMTVGISELGATIYSIAVPTRDGKHIDVVLGNRDLTTYATTNPGYFGATIGRVANRIKDAKFTIDGKEYHLDANDGPNCLHGGFNGIDRKVFAAEDITVDGYDGVKLTVTSPDGEGGFPGNVEFTVTYVLTDEGELKIDYVAKTDADTPIGMTNHSYFNLDGHTSHSIASQKLRLESDFYLPGTDKLVPTGEFAAVAGTPFDFREFKKIGADIHADDEQLKLAGGYDHSFCIRGTGLRLAATAYSDATGVTLKCFTTAPNMHFYTGNFVDGEEIGKCNLRYNKQCAFCLETELPPDCVNQTNLGNCIVKAGEEYTCTTIYQFGLK